MTSQPAPNDIEGIALGEDYSVADKRRARTGKDLDERIERRGVTLFGQDHDGMKEAWRNGLIELGWSNQVSDVVVFMTSQQRGLWGNVGT